MKLYLLDFGELTVDQGWFFEGGGSSTLSQPHPPVVRKVFKMIGALIEHPKHGPIIYEVGPAPNYNELWPTGVFEVFPVTRYNEENRLDNMLKKIGYTLKDINGIIIGHLHLDHAGGLEFFRGTGVPVYVHEKELKYAFYSVATKEDFGAYLPHYLDYSFNWQAIHENELELFDGISLYHTPGHTPGLISMKVELPNSGAFVFTSDTFFLRDNYEQPKPQGWLMRDMQAWFRSLKIIRNIVQRSNAKLVFGHDAEVFSELKKIPEYYD